MGVWWRLVRWTVSLLGAGWAPGSTAKVARMVASPDSLPPAPQRVSLFQTQVIAREGQVTLRVHEGMRFRHSPSDTTFAATTTRETLRDAVALERGRWAFTTDEGLYISPTFLGALQPLAQIPQGVTLVPGSHGRAVLRDAAGRLWSTDGDHAPTPLVTPGEVVDVAFRSDLRGALVVEGGGLYLTRDGGATWTKYAGRDVTAWSVRGSLAGLLVQTTRGVLRIDSQDHEEEARWPSDPPVDTNPDGVDVPRGRPSITADMAATLPPLATSGVVEGDAGPHTRTVLTYKNDGSTPMNRAVWDRLAPRSPRPLAPGYRMPRQLPLPPGLTAPPRGAIVRRAGDGYELLAPTEGLHNNLGAINLWTGQQLDEAGRPLVTRVWVGRAAESMVGFATITGRRGMWIQTQPTSTQRLGRASFVPWGPAHTPAESVTPFDGRFVGSGAPGDPSCAGMMHGDTIWIFHPRGAPLRMVSGGHELEPVVLAMEVRQRGREHCLAGVMGTVSQPAYGATGDHAAWREVTSAEPFALAGGPWPEGRVP